MSTKLDQNKTAKFPFDPSRSPFFYGWVIIIFGTLGLLMSIPGQTIGLSTFTDALIEALNISRDTLSMAYMAGTISSSLLLIQAGKWFDKFGARPVAITASICLGLGLLYMSSTEKLVGLLNHHINIGHTVIAFSVVYLGFLMIRFFGQGVLTLASKTMMMKWFDERRGFALGFSSVFVSGGFSIAPAFIESLIMGYSWQKAWFYMAAVLILVFPILVFIFFRDDPKEVGLKPDGDWQNSKSANEIRFPVHKDFELSEARKTFAFWIFAGFLALQGLYITGFTFHVVSIFEQFDYTRKEAVSIFQYIAIISVITTLLFSWISDLIPLKYLLFLMSIGAFLSLGSAMCLSYGNLPYYILILGTGLSSGMYGIISAVSWPRFFGKKHLGSIMGQIMMVLVFASALGPFLLSKSLTLFGSYSYGIGLCLFGFFILFLCTFIVKNPQRQWD